MNLLLLREILEGMITAAAISFREALDVGALERAGYIEVELDTLFRVIAIIDGL